MQGLWEVRRWSQGREEPGLGRAWPCPTPEPRGAQEEHRRPLTVLRDGVLLDQPLHDVAACATEAGVNRGLGGPLHPPPPAAASPFTACGMTVTSRRWLRIVTPWSGSCMVTTILSICSEEVEGLRRLACPTPRSRFPGTGRDAPDQCAWRLTRTDGAISGRRGARKRGDVGGLGGGRGATPAPGSPSPHPARTGPSPLTRGHTRALA